MLLIAILPVTAAGAQPPAAAATMSPCEELKRDPLPDWTRQADSLKRLTDCGYSLASDGEYARAQVIFALALDVARQHDDRLFQAVALAGDGQTLARTGQPDRAEPLLQESLQISEELDDKDAMAEACSQLGHLRTMRARYDEAREYHLRSFTLWQAIGKQRGMAVALNNVGASFQSVGDYVHAAEYFQRSLDGLTEIGDRRRSATVIDNLARIARRLGDFVKGLELSQQALAIRTALADREGIARSHTSLSESYRQQGNYGAALASLRKSLDLYTAIGVVHSTAETLNNIAVVYEAQGDYAQAAEYLRKAQALNTAKVGSPSLTAEIDTHLGEVLFARGDLTRAVQALVRSLAVSERGGFSPQAADARLILGRVYTALGRPQEAADALDRVLQFRSSTGDHAGRAEALIAMADVDRRRRQYPKALAQATEAQEIAAAIELVDVRWSALTAIGRIDRALGRGDDARRAFDEAIDVVEDLRSQNVGSEETRRQFFASRLAPYHERIALALATGQTADAFYAAERSKARALLDAIRGDRLPVTTAMTPAERSEETALRSSLNSVNTEVQLALRADPRDDEHVAALQRKRDAQRLALERFQTTLYAAHPELPINRGAAPAVRASDAEHLLATPSSAIVEFVAGRDRTHGFLVTTSGIRSFELKTATPLLARQIRTFRNQLAHRDLRAPESARALYETVLGPIGASLRRITDLIVVPDGILWELPFQALQPSAGHYLIEDAAVSYAPSVTVLREAMRRRPDRATAPTLLAFGNPAGVDPLPETEREVQQAGAAYGASSRVLVGAEATEDRWKAEAPKYGVLHLATHGVVDNASPMYSHLVLARPGPGDREDGLLEAWEIMNTPLRAELVVLSACDTAQGQVAPGEGLVGLMWAVFVAGSPATLVTQWAVDSTSSTLLVDAFHVEWRGRPGVSKARALQRAAVRVLKTRGFEDPFYWAGFILGGDGR